MFLGFAFGRHFKMSIEWIEHAYIGLDKWLDPMWACFYGNTFNRTKLIWFHGEMIQTFKIRIDILRILLWYQNSWHVKSQWR